LPRPVTTAGSPGAPPPHHHAPHHQRWLVARHTDTRTRRLICRFLCRTPVTLAATARPVRRLCSLAAAVAAERGTRRRPGLLARAVTRPSPRPGTAYKQIPENLSRKGCAPIIGEPRGVTWSVYIFVVFYSGDHSYADPQT